MALGLFVFSRFSLFCWGSGEKRDREVDVVLYSLLVSGLHDDALVLPFPSLFFLNLFCFLHLSEQRKSIKVERLLLLLMYDSHLVSFIEAHGQGLSLLWWCNYIQRLFWWYSCNVPVPHLQSPSHLLILWPPSFVRVSFCTWERNKQNSIPVHSLLLSPQTTVSLPFPGLIQLSPGALLPPRLALLSLSRRAEQRCQVWRVFADQIHMPDVMPTSSDMKIRSISDATYESWVLALNSPQLESW